MRTQWKSFVAVVAIVAMIPAMMPVSAAPSPGSRIEGMIIGADGSPAVGYEVHLVVPGGQAVQTATTNELGLYSFEAVAAGAYALGLVTVDGVAAPVLGDPIEVAEDQIVRRDLQLQPAEATAYQQAKLGGLGPWWAGTTTAAKVGVVIGFVAVIGFGLTALLDDDDEEDDGTPMEMEP